MRLSPATTDYDGPIVIIGFGSIGKGALPLILRHIRSPRDRMVVIDPDDSARRLAELSAVRSYAEQYSQLVGVYRAFGGGWVDEAERMAPQPLAGGAVNPPESATPDPAPRRIGAASDR